MQQKSNCGPISSDTRLTRVLRYHINDQLLNRRPMSAQHGPDQELAQNPTHFGFSPSSIFQPTATTGYRSGRALSRGALPPRRRSAASRNYSQFLLFLDILQGVILRLVKLDIILVSWQCNCRMPKFVCWYLQGVFF